MKNVWIRQARDEDQAAIEDGANAATEEVDRIGKSADDAARLGHLDVVKAFHGHAITR